MITVSSTLLFPSLTHANQQPGSHPLLAQVPLTVSPFITLPSATTLPYTYKQLPTTLPPSSAGITATALPSSDKPKYVISPSGHAAHPDDIIASCRALQNHISKLQADAEKELKEFDERVKARDLAEKRRLAPGWLDSDVRVLEPVKKDTAKGKEKEEGPKDLLSEDDGFSGLAGLDGKDHSSAQGQPGLGRGGASEMAVPNEGEELDRAFGGLGLGKTGGN
jgi:hypothetical protein